MKTFLISSLLLASAAPLAAQTPLAPPPVLATPAPGFVDVAALRGVASENSARTQLIDVNSDGWPDLVIGGAPLRILLSQSASGGGRTFVEGAKSSGLDDRDHSMLLWGDVNGDARLDAVSIVTQTAAQHAKNPQGYAVYLGDGRGHFTREKLSGLEQTRHTATHGAVLCDLDLDGKLDLAFGNQYDGADLEAQPMRVYRGDGRGHFTEITALWGFPTRTVVPGASHAPRPLYGLTATDLDKTVIPNCSARLTGGSGTRFGNVCQPRHFTMI